jgi:hypothetical protein
MRRKIGVAVTVFALAFGTAAGASSAENEVAAPDGPTALSGVSHMAIQGTAWVAEKPAKFRRWRTYAWGVETRAVRRTNQWVHIAVPTPTNLDGGYNNVYHVEFCAKADNPTKSAPKAIHIWANNKRVFEQAITWPDKTTQHCHYVTFNPAEWMESVGISVLVGYANRRDRVTLQKAWIAVTPAP